MKAATKTATSKGKLGGATSATDPTIALVIGVLDLPLERDRHRLEAAVRVAPDPLLFGVARGKLLRSGVCEVRETVDGVEESKREQRNQKLNRKSKESKREQRNQILNRKSKESNREQRES